MVALVHRFWTAAVEHEAKERRMLFLCVCACVSVARREKFVCLCVLYIYRTRARRFCDENWKKSREKSAHFKINKRIHREREKLPQRDERRKEWSKESCCFCADSFSLFSFFFSLSLSLSLSLCFADKTQRGA